MKWQDTIESIKAKQTPTVLRFCTKQEQIAIQQRIPSALFDGGYPGSERKRAYLFTEPTANITCLQLTYDSRYLQVTHQNILGTLMSLSISYDSIGDILPEQGVFFTTTELAEEIKRSFQAINHVPIELTAIDGRTVVSTQRYSHHQCLVSSMRLDLLVARITNQSRAMAQEKILQDQIKLNHQLLNKPTKLIQESDIVSIHRFGRFVIDDTTSRTKKGKIVVKYRKYE